MIEWVLAVVFVEAVTEILVASQFFEKFRDWLYHNSEFVHSLFSCGYCLSVWTAALVAWALPGVVTGYIVYDMIIKLFVLHRASNWFHELLTRWFNRLSWTISLHKTTTNFDIMEGSLDESGPESETRIVE